MVTNIINICLINQIIGTESVQNCIELVALAYQLGLGFGS